MSIDLSIVIATYNGEQFLKDQLTSIVNQKVKPQSVYISDDGSTDSTIEIVKKFAAIAPFPVYINVNTNRLGYGRNFFKAAILCPAKFVAFCDQDDVWSEEKLLKITNVIINESPDIVVHSGVVVDRELKLMGFRYPDIQDSGWLDLSNVGKDFFFPGYSIVIKRKTLIKMGVEKVLNNKSLCIETFAHDRWIFDAAKNGFSCYQLSEALVLYRQHELNHIGFFDGCKY